MNIKFIRSLIAVLAAYVIFTPVAHAYENNYLYLQANIGYARQPWQNVFGSFGSGTDIDWDNGNGGFTYGFNIGYHAYKYLGMEFGFFDLPTAKLSVDKSCMLGFSKATFRTYDLYLAARTLIPLTTHLQLFTKVGLHTKFVSGSRSKFNKVWRYHEPTKVGPAFAAGLQYMLKEWVGINVQYFYLGSKIENTNALKNSRTEVNPNVHMATIGLVYNFALGKRNEK